MPVAETPSRFVTLPSGTRARYHEEAAPSREAPVLLLLHGANLALEIWTPWFARLRGRFRLVAVDLPGHGLTGATVEHDYSLTGMVAFVDAFATVLGIDRPFALAGHSYGGEVAWRFALRHGARLSKLLLIAPAGLAEPAGAQRSIYRLARRPWGPLALRLFASPTRFAAALGAGFYDPATLTPAMAEQFWNLSRRDGNPAATIARIRAQRVEPKKAINLLREIEVPTLLLWGLEDVFPPALADRFVSAIPNAKLRLYQKCGHFPMIEAADASANDVAAFLDGATNNSIAAVKAETAQREGIGPIIPRR